MKWYTIALALALLNAANSYASGSGKPLADHLQPLLPYIGKTWKGTFTKIADQPARQDVARWERALNGKAIRILHSVNKGEYGGETLVMWDAAQQSLVFWYFTTADFHTQGTIAFEDGKMVSREAVSGNSNGITEVKSTNELMPGGRMLAKSQYLKNGQWVDGHQIHYVIDPEAKVTFK